MRLPLSLFAALSSTGILGVPLAAQTPPSDPLRALDSYIAAARETWHVPGLAIAIVKDDSIVLMKGYGVRTLGQPEPVDEETLFAIGSCSKAFTATLVGTLVSEGRMGWDDPAAKYLPDFQLFDPYVNRELTVRDLLTHRSGLSRGDLTWYASPLSRAEVLRQVRFLKPTWSLRATFGYQNVMFLAAGEAAAHAAGHSWDQLVRERFFLPLGMLRTNTSVKSLAGLTDVASPHTELHDTVRVIPWRDIDNIGPAGSINSTVRDMAEWVRLQLGYGRLHGRTLVDSTIIEETRSPQTVIRRQGLGARLNPATHFEAYGMGWFLSDYRGRLVVQHGGNIDGMSAYVALLPEEHLGFVLLSNLDGSPLRTPLAYRIFDAFLGGPARDWSREWKHAVDSLVADGRLQQAKDDSARVVGTSPSHPLEDYTGTFSDSLYGRLTVTLEEGHLVLRYGPALVYDLQHWHYDTFKGAWRDPSDDGTTRVTFNSGANGRIASLVANFEGDVTFARTGPAPK